MARAQKYTIPFAAIDGRQYAVNVYVEGYTGSVQTLTGASDPFYTSEIADHEWLTVPVRTQSGYIRIVCNEDEWRGMVPTSATSHYVELAQGSDVKWMGYIKPEAFTHALFSGTDEYEFPIQCPLSALEGIRPEWEDDKAITTFAMLLHRLLSMCNVEWEVLHFPRNLSDIYSDLLAQVNVAQFYEVKTRSVLRPTPVPIFVSEDFMSPNASALQILEAVCQFWGWECRVYRSDIYFTAPDEHVGWRSLTFQELGEFTDASTFDYASVKTRGLLTAKYMTAAHEVEVGLPCESVKVETDVDEVDDVLNFDIDQIGQFTSYPNSYTTVDNNHWAFCPSTRPSFENILSSGMLVTYTGAKYDDPTWASHAMTATEVADYYNLPFLKFDKWKTSDESTKTKYNPQTYLFLSPCPNDNTEAQQDATITSKSLSCFTFQNCAICIHGNVKTSYKVSANLSYIEFSVRIGNRYWDGSTWATISGTWTPQYFNVPIGSNSGPSVSTSDAVIVNNFRFDTPYQGAEGYIIPITEAITGEVEIIIKWTQYDFSYFYSHFPSATINAKWITDFGINVVQAVSNSASSPKLTDKSTYEATNQNQTGNDVNIELRFCTYNNNKAGNAFVMSRSGDYMSTLEWSNGSNSRPERHLVDRVASLYARPTEWREVDVEAEKNGIDFTIPSLLYLDQNGKYYAPIAAARQWAEGIVRLTLGDMGTWTPPASYNLADCNDWLLTSSGGDTFTVVGG